MEALPEVFPAPSDSIRRDTISTISSEKQPSLPSGKWPLTIHGNCARCGHHHKATMVYIHVIEGICEASPVICDRCGQKWLTIGGLNNTQISLLSTVTTDLDNGEINFRYTLFSMVRSAASIASPTALSNVPEDPSPIPSRSSSARRARELSDAPANAESRMPQDYHANPALSNVEVRPAYGRDRAPTTQKLLPSVPQARTTTLGIITRKLKNKIGIFRNARLRAFTRKLKRPEMTAECERGQPNAELDTQRHIASPGVVASVLSENEDRSKDAEDAVDGPRKTTGQVMEELKSIDKEAIRNMTPKQRDVWIREHITAFKRSKCCSSLQCACKRRHSTSSVGEYYSLLPNRSTTTTPTLQHHSLEQMGSQFDALPAGALFTHNGPLTISATRISEADTAVEIQEGSSSPRSSRLDLGQHAHRSRSPRPASLFRSRLSWQPSRTARTQRDSMDSVLAGTIRNSWRGWDRLSLVSDTPQDMLTGGDAPDLPLSSEPVVEENVSANSQ